MNLYVHMVLHKGNGPETSLSTEAGYQLSCSKRLIISCQPGSDTLPDSDSMLDDDNVSTAGALRYFELCTGAAPSYSLSSALTSTD